MTMFNITDGNNNVSRDKPVEHIDMVIGLHVSACTSCTRTMRVRRDIAIDITESVQLLVRFNALRSMPVWFCSLITLPSSTSPKVSNVKGQSVSGGRLDPRHACPNNRIN